MCYSCNVYVESICQLVSRDLPRAGNVYTLQDECQFPGAGNITFPFFVVPVVDAEGPFFQALVEQAVTIPVPVQKFQPVALLIEEYENMTRLRLLRQFMINKESQGVKRLSHVRWLGADINFNNGLITPPCGVPMVLSPLLPVTS